MRVPYEWLREYCAPDVSIEELEQLLTISGTKVEAIHHHGVPSTDNFVVGRILEAEQHPDADRLRVCKVDLGEGEPAQIVCGAPNAAAGLTVAVARPGAVMPDGTKLKKAKLRGVESQGMILSEDELGIGSDHAGIIELDGSELNGAKPGTPLSDVVPIATPVIEFEITPNRPDCLGVYGIAREAHAATRAVLAPAPWADDPGSQGAVPGIEISVECPDLCPRFTARVFENVAIGPSPRWMKARLMAAGMRPINNVVDITNYVMLLTGHPLHAFDLDRVAGGKLVIRRAADGEKVDTLDGQTRELDSDMVVIEDGDGPTSIAGLMGGARSEVHDGTTRVLMEVANWIGHNIKSSSMRLGLRSEASGRFEKGLAPEQARDAQAVATKLMIELCGATVAAGTVDAGPFAGEPWPLAKLELRESRVEALLGMEIARERQQQVLTALGFDASPVAGGFNVEVPAFRRNDVTREADLIEEVARFELDALPSTLPARRGAAGRISTEQRMRRRALDALIGRGAHEAVGWSFTDPGLADRLRLPADDPRRQVVELINPMSEEQSVLRTTLAGSLLDVARLNVSRSNPDLILCELGSVYARGDAELPAEHRALGALVHGRLHAQSWGVAEAPSASFFAVKGLLGTVFDALRVPWSVRTATQPFLHPGRSAEVIAGGEVVGWIGEVHPLVAREWDLGVAAIFEVDLDRVVTHAVTVPRYEPIAEFPPAKRDLAFLVGPEVTSLQLVESIRLSGGSLLRDVSVFDVYELEEGARSIAARLTFQSLEKTLTDEEIGAELQTILKGVETQTGAVQRV